MSVTLDYYEKNARAFTENTLHVDFSQNQEQFLKRMKPGAAILDFGCGSGRDAKYFLDHGFEVEACDDSKELCVLASEYIGIDVRHMYFDELSEYERYDGIWACASILHLTEEELVPVMRKMSAALKADGSIYTSFKYGLYSGIRNGRYFTDMTKESFEALLLKVGDLSLAEYWITSDVRPGRDEEKWLNVILVKNTHEKD